MTACAWPGGCSVTQSLGDDGLCSYHAKVSVGLIDTTRGEGSKAIVPVPMTPSQQHKAQRAKRDRFEAMMAAEEERRAKVRAAVERQYRDAMAAS